MTLRLRNDVVLVLLAPAQDMQATPTGLYLAPVVTPPPTSGRVRQIGPGVHDVAPGDLVAFPSTAGVPVIWEGYAHLLIREPAIAAIIHKDEAGT